MTIVLFWLRFASSLIWNAHVSAERAFEGLTWRQAGVQVPNSPQTIWQLLKHLNYWQDRFISRIEGMKVLPAKTSED
jgi:hypothetical protein